MFKKITSIILAMVLVLSFAGCAQDNTTTTGAATDGSTAAATETTAAATTEAQGIDTDENLFTVDITLPASLFENQDMATFDTEAYTKEQGFIATKVNEDGSVTVTLTKGRHKELLEEMAASLETAFAEFVGGESTQYIKEITHNDDFTEVTMKVDRAAYENAFDFTPFAIALSVAMYQAFTETEFHVDINVVDVTTGDNIKTISYPDTTNG